MGVYRRAGRRNFIFEFTLDGARYWGSTGADSRAAALNIERQKRLDALAGRLKPVIPKPAPVTDVVRAAWEAAVEVVAATYGLSPALLRSESAGKGPRPPRGAWEARKMAVHLAVVVADCTYAEIGRAVGLHKDTAASHCASVRDACADSDELERLSDGLETCVRIRLAFEGAGATALRSAA